MVSKGIYIVMGVSGSGKTTVGTLLANTLQLPFFDGDDYHPESNVKKMASGKALNDQDRKEWLETLNRLAREHKSIGAVIACSALKESYRASLRKDVMEQMTFIYLKGSFSAINRRLQGRKGHYMPISLLKSQFETLEPPKDAIEVSINQSPEDIVNSIRDKIT
ncbi:gluconokinase [Maribacter polysaccharolyticus]|uniref:gluconokinase n=1 Tax=Maribacter polysaccharolyticus TaxID=3020831 RepID=UPI00237F2C6E|nr:gluconokinase [Maribacter polysaccharolyticus]MDE3740648.1 gluconokinase [Maribacter polysaccharolyticus]